MTYTGRMEKKLY